MKGYIYFEIKLATEIDKAGLHQFEVKLPEQF
jgi:hypothetical protein